MQLAAAYQPVLDRYRALAPAIYWTITAIGAAWCFLIVFGFVGYVHQFRHAGLHAKSHFE